MADAARRSTPTSVAVMLGLLAAALVPATLLAQAPPGPGTGEPWWGWVLLGRFHPFVVHFPIGLLLAGAAVELVQWTRGRVLPTDVGSFCLVAGLAGGALAVWFGTLNAGHQSITGTSAEILEWHQVAGWAVLALGAIAWVAGRAASRGAGARTGYVAAMTAVAVAVAATGHYGGQLVYGSTYMTSVLPWNQSTADERTASAADVGDAAQPDAAPAVRSPGEAGDTDAPAASSAADAAVGSSVGAADQESHLEPNGTPPAHAASAVAEAAPEAPTPAPAASRPAVAPTGAALSSTVDAAGDVAARAEAAPVHPSPHAVATSRVSYVRDVAPLLRATCVECHGPDKVKARLRMDSVEALRAGGKSGPLFVPGDPEQSLMMRRVLGLDDEDQMPLDADPLTPVQIDLLRRWIVEGAAFDAPPSDDAAAR